MFPCKLFDWLEIALFLWAQTVEHRTDINKTHVFDSA